MNILVIGGGGREHALVWKLAQSQGVETVYCCPGNGGTNGNGVCNIAFEGYEELALFALENRVGLVVVGPEKPLCEGIVDIFRSKGIKIFGPTKEAAQLEGSKWYAKEFMLRHKIPTAEAKIFSDQKSAIDHVKKHGAPIVVKADGLASGKGVTVAATVESAIIAIKTCFDGVYGKAGNLVILEECLTGEEASILAFVDRFTIKPLASSQDHKRLMDRDLGPNTGGMGAYSPAPIVDKKQWTEIKEKILDPFLRGCQSEGLDYRGIIYAGLMISDKGPKVLEFNVRFGDPEAQAILPRLDSDLTEAFLATIDNRLSAYEFKWLDRPSVCVVMASKGYPEKPETGFLVKGIEEAKIMDATIFHAGTRQNGPDLVTSGGRVLGITSCGNSIEEAAQKAYKCVEKIDWSGLYYRRDIAQKAYGP